MLVHSEVPAAQETSLALPHEGVASRGQSLEVASLGKSYGGRRVLKDVSCSAAPGTMLFVLGPSGCGKTTLLRCIAGLLHADSGVIRVGGEDVTSIPCFKRNVGIVFQNYALFPHMSVRDNIAFGLKVRKVPKQQQLELVASALELVQLHDLSERFPNQLSGGQQQRVALARTIVTSPRLLLLDEPLSNLDARLRDHMRLEIRALQRRLGLTTVFVTHDQREALTMADMIVVLEDGEVQQIGSPYDVYERPSNLFVAGFMGDVNIFPGRLIRCLGDADNTVEVAGQGDLILVAKGEVDPLRSEVAVIVRPENAWLEASSDGDMAPSAANQLRGEVVEAGYFGSDVALWVRTPVGQRVHVRGPVSANRFGIGSHVTVRWKSESARVVAV